MKFIVPEVLAQFRTISGPEETPRSHDARLLPSGDGGVTGEPAEEISMMTSCPDGSDKDQ